MFVAHLYCPVFGYALVDVLQGSPEPVSRCLSSSGVARAAAAEPASAAALTDAATLRLPTPVGQSLGQDTLATLTSDLLVRV